MAGFFLKSWCLLSSFFFFIMETFRYFVKIYLDFRELSTYVKADMLRVKAFKRLSAGVGTPGGANAVSEHHNKEVVACAINNISTFISNLLGSRS